MAGVNSILFVLKGAAQDDAVGIQKWWSTAKTIASHAKQPNKHVELLNAGTWLIHSNEGLRFLGRAIGLAVDNGLEYKVLFFDKPFEFEATNVEAKPS
jgi:hypothetical protein